MKCIKCDTDNILKDRTANSGRCKICNHPFVFEPTTMTGVKVTDPQFKKAIEAVSSNNTLFFTPTQLAYVLDSRVRRTSVKLILSSIPVFYIMANIFGTAFGVFVMAAILGMVSRITGKSISPEFILIVTSLIVQGFAIYWLFKNAVSSQYDNRGRRRIAQYLRILGFIILFVGTFASVVIAQSFFLFSVVVCMGIGAVYLSGLRLAQPISSQEFLFKNSDFQDWLKRWQVVNQEMPKLLPSPRQQLSSTVVNPDVTAYSFDRLVVCDRSEIAQLLISNNFHFENNCAVLSIAGYPESIFDTTMQMLHRNPNLKVYVVHDCSPKGMGLVQRLKSSDRWFKDRNVLMIDIGLTPRQVLSAKGIFIQTSAESARDAAQTNRSQWEGLAPDEIKWLEAGNYVELESFTPQRLIQVINRGIAGSRDLSYDDGYSGSDGFISSSDSFG
jgi:hypothetical protein